MAEKNLAEKPYSAHVQMTVENALSMSDKELMSWFGEPLSGIRDALNQMKESGRIYIHTEGCDNEDPVTGKCLKHY